MKHVYRGWWLSQEGENIKAVKGNQIIIGETKEIVMQEIDRLILEELLEEIKD